MTAEGKIKAKVRFILDNAFANDIGCHYETLVTHGFGKPGLDFTCCIFGWFVAIETKAPGEWLTPRQRQTCLDVLRSGGKVFIISNDDGLRSLAHWIMRARAACR